MAKMIIINAPKSYYENTLHSSLEHTEIIITLKGARHLVSVHYGSIVGKPSDGDVFTENVKSPVKVVFKIQF